MNPCFPEIAKFILAKIGSDDFREIKYLQTVVRIRPISAFVITTVS